MTRSACLLTQAMPPALTLCGLISATYVIKESAPQTSLLFNMMDTVP